MASVRFNEDSGNPFDEDVKFPGVPRPSAPEVTPQPRTPQPDYEYFPVPNFDARPQTASSNSASSAPSQSFVDQLARDYAGRSDVYSDPSSIQAYLSGRLSEGDLRALADRRAGPTSHRSYDSQTSDPVQQAANAEADRRIGAGRTPAAAAAAASALSPRPQEMPGFQMTGPYGAGYANAYNTIQQAAKQYLGGYMTQQELDAHLHNMGWRADRDPDANILRSVQEWAPTLAQSPEAQEYARRAASQRASSSASTAPASSSSGPSASAPQFGDPSARLVEDYALDRFNQRQNPDAHSGTALYEQYLRDYAGTLQGDPYSPTEESQIKQTAYNAIESERTATKQRWIDEVSRRGFLPSSGVALDGMKQIDEHYGRVRAEADNAFATNAITLTRQNRAQAAGVLGSLATNEEGRLSDALTYAMLPLSLQDRAFNQGLQLTGAGGNPAGLSSSALGVLQMLQQSNQMNAANRTQFTQGLMQYLGYLFA